MARNGASPGWLRLLTGSVLVGSILFLIDARVAAADTDKTSDSIAAAPRASVITPSDVARLEHASGDPRRFALVLREQIERLRGSTIPEVEHTLMRESAHRDAWVAGGIACASLLALPWVIVSSRKRREGTRLATPFGYVALAAGLVFFGMSLLAGTLLATERLQALAGRGAAPNLTAMTATLDALDDGAEQVERFGPAVVTPLLRDLGAGDTTPLPAAFVGAVGRHAPDAEGHAPTFETAAVMARALDAGAQHVPAALVLLVVLVFLSALRPTLREILEMPARASSDEAHVAEAVRRSVLIRVARELGVTLVLALSTTALAFASTVAVSAVVRPATRVLLHYTLAAGDWMKAGGASSPAILGGLSAGIVFVGLSAIFVVAGCVAFVDKTHRLLQQRAHERAALPPHADFWRWAPSGVALVLILPAVFGHTISALVEGPLDRTLARGAIGQTTFFATAPLLLVLGFVIVFWAARGFRAIGFIARYPIRPEATPTTARSPSITPQPMDAPADTPATAAPIPVRARYSGSPQLVTTLPSASSAPPPPLEGSPVGPLSTTTPSAIAPSELAQKQKPR